MKILAYSILVILLTSSSLIAQRPGGGGPNGDFKGEISGQILDKKSNKPVEYASISIYKMKDTSLVSGTISDAKGYFTMKDVPGGKYFLKVDFIGYNRYSGDVMVTPKTPQVNVGVIKLEGFVQQLGEVNVVDQKPLVEFNLDKKVINVEQNIVTTGGSATDILRNTPAVSVDMDGNVSLRGSTNVRILIDGKPAPLASSAADALEQIPASSVQSIELITNPSAKYDPEGMTGILNIITKKEKRNGLNGLASVGIGTWNKYNASVSLNYRVNKFNFFGGYDFRSEERNGSRSQYRTMYRNDTATYYDINAKTTRDILSHSFKGGLDYDFNPMNTLTFSGNFRTGGHPGTSDGNYLIKDYNMQVLSDYKRYEDSPVDNNTNADLNLSYRKRFSRPIQELTADVYYTFGKFSEDEYFYEDYNYPSISGQDQLSQTVSDRTNLIVQSDYIHPLNEKWKLETGIKTTFREMDTDYKFYNLDSITTDYVATSLSNHFIYTDQVYAGYGIVSGSFKKITGQAGIRAEQSMIQGNQIITNQKFDVGYLDFFPSVHMTYELPAMNKVQLSYSRRINRPDHHALDPFIDASDPLTLRTGNPQLKPEYINSYELSHIKDWKKVSFTSSIFYKNIENIISRYRITNDTIPGILVTMINANSGKSYGLDFIITYQPIKPIRLAADFSCYKTSVDGSYEENDLTNDIYSYDGKLNATFVLPKDFSLQINFRVNGPSVMPQSIREGFWTTDAAIRKDFWDRKASLSLRMSDIFNTMEFKIRTTESDLVGNMVFKRESRVVFLTFSYRLNEVNNARKKVVRKWNRNR
jgi:outer membrane receptor protein involved in Fe transport